MVPAPSTHPARRPQGALLRGQLPPFLNGFFQNSEPVVVRLMDTVSEVLHRLGPQGAGAQSLRVAVKARSFFDDVSTRARPPGVEGQGARPQRRWVGSAAKWPHSSRWSPPLTGRCSPFPGDQAGRARPQLYS